MPRADRRTDVSPGPVDASRFAYTACGGYKWLLSLRGTAYFTINRALIDDLTPHHAGWDADEDPWSSTYGGTVCVLRWCALSSVPGLSPV